MSDDCLRRKGITSYIFDVEHIWQPMLFLVIIRWRGLNGSWGISGAHRRQRPADDFLVILNDSGGDDDDGAMMVIKITDPSLPNHLV